MDLFQSRTVITELPHAAHQFLGSSNFDWKTKGLPHVVLLFILMDDILLCILVLRFSISYMPYSHTHVTHNVTENCMHPYLPIAWTWSYLLPSTMMI